MLRFLVDASTGLSSALFLRQQGHDIIFVDEWKPQADDSEIVVYAHQERRIIVTNDKDFGEKVYRDRFQAVGILLLRLADDRTESKLRTLQAVLARYETVLSNSFVVATERHIRVRTLPTD